jgi:phospholipase/carboxylesterase
LIVVWRRPAKAGATTPLVVFLHGRGADENDLIDLADGLPNAYTYASVRAPVRAEFGGYTWFRNRGIALPVPESLRESIAGFRAWLDDPGIGCATRPCYLFGFSAGMMMASALLLDDPQRFAGAVLLSGAIPLDAIDAPLDGRFAALPIFYARGTYDDVIPQHLVTQSERYLRERSGADLTVHTYPHEHSISNRELEDIADWFSARA